MNKEQYVVDDHGRKTAVILPVKIYDQMLEDIHDLAVVAQRRKEGVVTLNEMKKRLKKSGRL
jgi:PHD/YefM family antitoxin component YafN of YafNO toxin-antitoxin module